MFVVWPVCCALWSLCWLIIQILQELLTWKDSFIEFVFGAWPAGWYLQIFPIRQYIVCIRSVRNGTLLHIFLITSQKITHVNLYKIIIHNSWALDVNSYAHLEVLHMFVKFLVVFDRDYMFKLFYIVYILLGFNHLSMVISRPLNGVLARSRDFPLEIILCETSLHQFMSDFTESYNKCLLCLWYSSLYCALDVVQP